MASHFQWYSDSPQVTPWNARYTFPTQANKATIVTPRISPKNGGLFTPGNVIRVEFPAQGYINPASTFLEFDLTLSQSGVPTGVNRWTWLRLQNNVNSIFSRVRLMYGSTPLEDIIHYNQIVRNLTEWTATSGQTHDQTSITEGIGGASAFYNLVSADYFNSSTLPTAFAGIPSWRNVRQSSIQGIDSVPTTSQGFVPNGQTISGFGSTRRYQVSFALGLFTQGKLIPAKYMASQLAIELTLAPIEECLYNGGIFTGTGQARYNLALSAITPSYTLTNVNLIPQILEFDSSYDASILKGLSTGGVPIKFSSWHTYEFTASGSIMNLQIQERSRSVKSIYAVLKRAPSTLDLDSGATLFMPVLDHTLQSYQYRIGGRYFPASPVQTSLGMNSRVSNGGAEACCELQKALNIVGDYRLSAGVNSNRFGTVVTGSTGTGWFPVAAAYGGEAEMDFDQGVNSYTVLGSLMINSPTTAGRSGAAGGLGSACFCMATSLESSNGMEIAGLNAEEQSDIMLIANYSTPIPAGYNIEVYTYYDAMLVLKENNTIVLVQ